MDSIIELLRNAPDFMGGKGVPEGTIRHAESQIGVSFAADYKRYLSGLGVAYFDGHELTGISAIERLDVVKVTLSQRSLTPGARYWYVIEETNIDGVVIWQSPSGEIYQTASSMDTLKLCDSLTEYLVELL